MTNDLSNLSLKSEYKGTTTLTVGNGNKLKISHIDTNTLPVKNGSTLILHKVLYVSDVSKKLISISSLLCDNNLSVLFTDNICIVKDK